MPPITPSHVLLYSADAERADLRTLLDTAGYDVAARGLDAIVARHVENVPHEARLLVVDSLRESDQALQLCQRLRTDQHEQFVPILFVGGKTNGSHFALSLNSGADAYLNRPFAPAELVAQVQALLRIKDRHDQLAAQAAESGRVTKRLQTVHRQHDQELELARRIQESFLPQTLPQLPSVRFAVKYRPCGHVGGDFYDVFRLDERHVGFYVADAMGHGVPASLLTIFVKKSVRAKEINGQSYRLVPPDEVLQKLNRDLIEQALADMPFITMLYALFDHVEGTLRFSRAGHPHPLYLPRDGPPQQWQLNGSLLGVFDTQFSVQTEQLRPGDKLIIYTDGMDAACFDRQPVGLASLLAAAERFRAAPIADFVEQLAQDLFTQTRQGDDLTILGMEMLE
jgi:sigma-B regulation protein RsbU (phosphoserine phosphatase)